MGMGYSATLVVAIDLSEIKNMNLSSFKDFLQALKEHEVTLDEFGESVSYGDTLDVDITKDEEEDLIGFYNDFQKEFKEKTGIDIEINYHNSDNNGSKYDDLNGYFFELNFMEMYELTDAAKELKKNANFNFKSYVQYG